MRVARFIGLVRFVNRWGKEELLLAARPLVVPPKIQNRRTSRGRSPDTKSRLEVVRIPHAPRRAQTSSYSKHMALALHGQ